MTSLGQAFVEVRAKVDSARVTADIRQGLVSPISRGSADAEKSVRGHVAGMSGAFRSLGPVLAGTFAGAAVGAGVLKFFKTGLSEVKDYQAGLAQAQQVILSTGGAAGVSAGHVETLASAIEKYSGQTDDSIVKSENLLLTFTNIRNSAGKNNDIFDQATKLSADMAKVFGGDASSSAIQLGKALNDPTAGITALSRVGVSFTAGQKATIKSLQDSGDVAGAQKVILAELQKEVGGSAAAYGKTLPGQLDIAKRSLESVAQAVVTAMLPALTKTLSFVTSTVIPAMGRLGDFLQANVVPALKAVGSYIAANVLPVLQRLGAFIVGTVVPAFQKAAAFVGGQAAAAFKFIGDKIAENRPQLEALLKGFGKVVAFVASVLGPALVLTFGVIVRVIGTAIGNTISTIGTAVRIFGVLYRAAQTMAGFVSGAFHIIQGAGQVMWDFLKAAFRGIVDAFLTVAGAIVHGAASAFGWVPGVGGKLKGAARAFDAFRGDVERSLGGLGPAGEAAGSAIGAGLSAGMRSKLAQVNADAAALAGAAIRGVRTTAGIRSPSTVFAELGQYSAQGFALGINKQAHLAGKASADLVRGALAAAAGDFPSLGWTGPPVANLGNAPSVARSISSSPSAAGHVDNSTMNLNITTTNGVSVAQVQRALRLARLQHA